MGEPWGTSANMGLGVDLSSSILTLKDLLRARYRCVGFYIVGCIGGGSVSGLAPPPVHLEAS